MFAKGNKQQQYAITDFLGGVLKPSWKITLLMLTNIAVHLLR